MDNIEFLKKIVSNETLNQYEQLRDCENYLNDEEIHKNNYKIEGSEIILYIALKELMLSIKSAKKQLNKQKLIIGYNNFVYKIGKLLKMIERDEQLETTIKKITFEKKDKLTYLNILNKILTHFYINSNINDLSTIYLYYSALLTSHQTIDEYLDKLLTINESSNKRFSVSFNDDIDIEQTLTNIDKIKSLVMTYKNNQENS